MDKYVRSLAIRVQIWTNVMLYSLKCFKNRKVLNSLHQQTTSNVFFQAQKQL